MPNQNVIPRSAGINFGVPNSEYRLRINPVTGEALSCYNLDTDTEYIGGGGDSDFSIAKVTVINNAGRSANIVVVNAEAIEDNAAAVYLFRTINNGASLIMNIPLYRGKAYYNPSGSGYNIEVSGDIVQSGVSYLVTGDGTLTLTASTS